jgi:hypothetical protein
MRELLTEWNWTFIGWNSPENGEQDRNREHPVNVSHKTQSRERLHDPNGSRLNTSHSSPFTYRSGEARLYLSDTIAFIVAQHHTSWACHREVDVTGNNDTGPPWLADLCNVSAGPGASGNPSGPTARFPTGRR